MSIQTEGDDLVGLAVLDDKGRISLPKPVRTALGVGPGSAVACAVLDGTDVLIPQDQHLARVMERAATALAAAGLTVQDLLAELPAARDEVMYQTYGPELIEEMGCVHPNLTAHE